MNSRPLPFYFRGLRAGFGGLRILAIIGVILYPALLIMLSLGIPGTPAVGLTSVRFDPKSIAFSAARNDGPAPVRLVEVTGKLELQQDIPETDPLYRIGLQSNAASQFGRALLYLVIFHLLFTICRNIERGELFTELNFCLVRRLGAAMILMSIAIALIDSWGTWRIDRYIAGNVVLDGLKSAPGVADPGVSGFLSAASHAGLSGSFFFTRFIVLLLAEIFRQAVVIKQDHDLTI